MKIKHWQGYGSVIAKKIDRKINGNEIKLHIRVQGNHECGIERNDVYDVVNWLGKRFDKQLTDYRQVTSMKLEPSYDIKTHEDICDYLITYKIP